ncbi:hypothetical protein [Chelativorans sp. ZYF759]|uniref:hypothetical protein n=1 Tax=Chelativorans sp. ZYF759 TaxID=2692213 RepID=UPI00145C4AA9|nr:hypothetical protein [Chelativorans sp. ZYF759]
MKRMIPLCAAAALVLTAHSSLHASEAAFLESFSGSWSGGGQVRLSPEDDPVNVTCRLDGTSGENSASLDGSCTGMILFTREVAAELAVVEGGYAGTYVGSRRGPGQLQGARSGTGLELTLEWRGHPPASMSLANAGDGRMTLTTIEPHPDTGEPVVTAALELERQ